MISIYTDSELNVADYTIVSAASSNVTGSRVSQAIILSVRSAADKV